MPFTDPMDLFRAAATAARENRWNDVAALCDPISLRQFKTTRLKNLAAPAPTARPITAEDIRRFQPDLPIEVAEYQAEQHRIALEGHTERMLQELPGFDSIDAVAAAEPVAVFTAHLDGTSPRRKAQRHIDAELATRAAVDRYLAHDTWIVDAIGVIYDGDNVAHVGYRSRFPAIDESDDDIRALPSDEQRYTRDLWGRFLQGTTTCRRQHDGSWLLIAGYDLMFVSRVQIIGVPGEDDPIY